MRSKAFLYTLAVIAIASSAAGAQTQSLALAVSTAKPTVDGVVAASEYPLATQDGKRQLSLSRTADTVYAAITADTTGWVAVGFDSQKMDGALIVIGYVAGGKAQVKLQKGSGHTHADADPSALVQYAMTEADGKTTLEVALKASAFLDDGQKILGIIFAFSGADNFTTPHRERSAVSVTLK